MDGHKFEMGGVSVLTLLELLRSFDYYQPFTGWLERRPFLLGGGEMMQVY